MSSFIAPPPSHVTSGPSMQEILFSSSPRVASSEWQTESRAQFCTYVVTPRPVPSTMVPTSFGMAVPVPQPTPPQYPLVGNWMQAPVKDGPAASSHAQQMVATQPEPQALQQQQQQQQQPLAPASAPENADKPAADDSASGAATEQAKPAAASRFPRSKSPKGRKPPFHTYGRANTKPTAGGFMYGDYLATHNAVAGRTIPRSKRPTAVEMGGAQVHYMEHDMRQSHMRSAHYQSPSHEEPLPAPATSKDKHRAEVKAAATQAKTEATVGLGGGIPAARGARSRRRACLCRAVLCGPFLRTTPPPTSLPARSYQAPCLTCPTTQCHSRPPSPSRWPLLTTQRPGTTPTQRRGPRSLPSPRSS